MRPIPRTRALLTVLTCLGMLLVLGLGLAATASAVDPGSPLWTRTYGGDGDQRWVDAAACPNGDVLVLGSTTTTVTHITVARYAPSGARRWVKVLDTASTANDSPVAIRADALGNALIAGSRGFDLSTRQYLVCKYSPKGRLMWKRLFDAGHGGSNAPADLALTTAGDACVTGYCNAAGDVDGSLTARLRAGDGKVVMRCVLTGTNTLTYGHALAVERSGSIYVTGFGDRGDGRSEMVTIKLRAEGNVVWKVEAPGEGTLLSDGREIDLAPGGRLYVSGTTGPVGPSSTLIVARYTAASGTQEWLDALDVPGGSIDWVAASAVDRNGNLFIAGDAGNQHLPDRAFVARWSPTKARWVYARPTDDSDSSRFTGIVPDQAGGCWVAGSYTNWDLTAQATVDLYAARINKTGRLKWQQLQAGVLSDIHGNGLVACGAGLAAPGYSEVRASGAQDARLTMLHR